MIYDLILEGSKEFYPNLSNKKYYISIVLGDDKITNMNNIFSLFIKKETIYIGIDFEFNKVSRTDRDVALMQINLEDNTDTGYIFILDPKIIKNKSTLIELLTMKSAIKILHGSESLDIPYLFDKLLKTKKNIDNFCTNFYDTKYICDYNKQGQIKCGIYDILLSSKIITKNKFDELENMSNDIGPLYNIYININKLLGTTKKNYNIFIYSLYDVIYLPELIKKYIFSGNIYRYIIPEITAIVFKYKRGIDDKFEELQKLITKYDNNTILIDNKKVKLIELWEIIYYYVSDDNYYFDNLKKIDYFRKFITNVTKLILYNNLLKTNNFDKYLNWLKDYKNFYSIINNYNDNINKI